MGDIEQGGERNPLLGGRRRREDDEEGVSIHDVMEHTSFLHFGYGRNLVRGSSDAFTAMVICFMLAVVALVCLLCCDLTHKEWLAVGQTLEAFGVSSSNSTAIYAPPVFGGDGGAGNSTDAAGGPAPPAPNSLMWLVVSHQLLHVATLLFEGAAIATVICASFFALCFMWPNVCHMVFAVLPLTLMGIGMWFWTVAFAAGLFADWHLFVQFWFGAIVLCCCCGRGCCSVAPSQSQSNDLPLPPVVGGGRRR